MVKSIHEASAALIGAGNLGSFVGRALAKRGCRQLLVVDRDVVEDRNLANQGYELLFKAFIDRGDFREVIRLAEQAIKHDFLNEEAHRTKLIALARLGKREEALRHFKRTDQHLSKKFGLAPGEELVKTFQQILRGQLR